MNKNFYHIATFVFSLLSISAKGQLLGGHNSSCDSTITIPLDNIRDNKTTKLKQFFSQQIDSLKSKGNLSIVLQRKLDSLNEAILFQEKHNGFLALEQKIKDHFASKYLGQGIVSSIETTERAKMNDMQSVSIELGIAPFGEDLNPNINTTIPDTSVPRLPAEMNEGVNIPDVNTRHAANSELPTEGILGQDLKISAGQLPGEVGLLRKKAGELSEVMAGDLTRKGDEYGKDINVIKEEGLTKSEKLSDLAEKQLAEINEVKALQAEVAPMLNKEAEYKKLLEQYKDEQKIKADLKAKAVDQATEIVTKYQSKVDASMKRISKLSRKFPQVADMRYLPKHAPNPLKDLSWRERLIPGFTFQTLNNTTTWVEFDPQVYYRIDGKWSAGVGGMYRFSVNAKKATVSDLDNLKGGKVFVQYHAFKGFYLRGEGQFVKWKPWDMKFIDPDFTDQTYVAAAGIGKAFQITKRIKGSSQALYHFHWNGMDPYRPKVMIRIGIDISLKKREIRPWDQKFKELKKQELRLGRELKSKQREVINREQSYLLKKINSK